MTTQPKKRKCANSKTGTGADTTCPRDALPGHILCDSCREIYGGKHFHAGRRPK